MKTKTIVTTAWLTGSYSGPEDLRSDDQSNTLRAVGYSDMAMESVGWTRIGPARIEIDIPDEQALIDNKVESLKKEKEKVLADAYARSVEIEASIQKLLAITYEVPA